YRRHSPQPDLILPNVFHQGVHTDKDLLKLRFALQLHKVVLMRCLITKNRLKALLVIYENRLPYDEKVHRLTEIEPLLVVKLERLIREQRAEYVQPSFRLPRTGGLA